MEDNHQEPRAKKARGKGKLGFLNDLKDGDKVQVELYCGCPTGETRKHLGHYIGFLAKDGRMLPLSVSYWKYMAPARIEAATQEIKHIFEYPEILDDKIINKLNLSWKAHKSNMKKQGFDVNRTREENLAHRPEGVVGSQWAPLVEMWESEENQKIAAKNEENRAKQIVHHTGGSKPHMEYAKELEAKLGKFPERLDIFEVTRSKRSKTSDPSEAVMDPVAAEQYARMVEIQKQANQPGSGVVLSGRSDAVSAVLGPDKRGRVRCLGTVKPKEFWGDDASLSKAAELQSENDRLRQALTATKEDFEMATKRIFGTGDTIFCIDKAGDVKGTTATKPEQRRT
ncbi:uncharacterized protein LOC113329140 [Papaver somniferum]|uniref:uncharacterized protein LOC113329140 n=1 Tax=Papaver somniferum TaxID=3469 RepID=UPI000E704F24|nr:uncharacterized protein LOC113329140 [Papaver somniferum]XP_026431883.1 uncharacterized protein LOC113329140 [Papaver somniferum]XP_026431884.1 uncharacterized protein LOC113329140 [Papaver somniferum]